MMQNHTGYIQLQNCFNHFQDNDIEFLFDGPLKSETILFGQQNQTKPNDNQLKSRFLFLKSLK